MDNSAEADGLRQKLERYHPSQSTIDLVLDTSILLLVGISGAGKSSIKEQLLLTGKYHHIVSHTTRAPRENHGVLEMDGQEYHFIDLAKAEEMLDQGAFVEAKMYSGNIYGTSVAEIQQAHDDKKIAMTDIEVQGVAEYEKIAPSIQVIFLLPPSYEVWQQRLSSRYEDNLDQQDLKRRMQAAKMELQEALDKDYYNFVINDDLGTVTQAVDAIAHGTATNNEAVAGRALATELLARL